MTDKLQGKWVADLERWAELDPEMAAFGPTMLEQLLGSTEVVFTDNSFQILGFGKKGNIKEFTFEARPGDDALVLDCTMVSSGKQGVYEITFRDDNHIDMILTEPKRDAMALKRP